MLNLYFWRSVKFALNPIHTRYISFCCLWKNSRSLFHVILASFGRMRPEWIWFPVCYQFGYWCRSSESIQEIFLYFHTLSMRHIDIGMTWNDIHEDFQIQIKPKYRVWKGCNAKFSLCAKSTIQVKDDTFLTNKTDILRDIDKNGISGRWSSH